MSSKKIISNQMTHTPLPPPHNPPLQSQFYNERILARWLPVIGRELRPMVQRKMPRRLLKVSGF